MKKRRKVCVCPSTETKDDGISKIDENEKRKEYQGMETMDLVKLYIADFSNLFN